MCYSPDCQGEGCVKSSGGTVAVIVVIIVLVLCICVCVCCCACRKKKNNTVMINGRKARKLPNGGYEVEVTAEESCVEEVMVKPGQTVTTTTVQEVMIVQEQHNVCVVDDGQPMPNTMQPGATPMQPVQPMQPMQNGTN
jgi:hypothetical protein